MRVMALTSFSGVISMARGEERDIKNDVLLEDLLQAGYVKTLEVEERKAESETSTDEESESEQENKAPESETLTDEESKSEPEVATSQKTSKRSVKSNESKRTD